MKRVRKFMIGTARVKYRKKGCAKKTPTPKPKTLTETSKR